MAGERCGLNIGGNSREAVCEATRPEIVIWEYLTDKTGNSGITLEH